jgi:dTDP-4-amino-4,6-dideoxygalactose transaminase
VVITNPSLTREDFTVFLEQKGIETRPFFNILGQVPYIKAYGETEADCPVARTLSENGFYIGCHQQMTRHDLWQIVESVKEFTAKVKVAA